MTKSYTAEHIRTLDILEAIRSAPGMYIGGSGTEGLHQILYEVLDNAIDEALAGYARKVRVTIRQDGAVEVEDNGRGIPVEIMPVEGESAMTVVFTRQHAGSKFRKESSPLRAYAESGGVHGTGIKCTTAMSQWLEVTVRRYGLIFKQRFENGGQVRGPVEIYAKQKDPIAVMEPGVNLVLDEKGRCVAIETGKKTITRFRTYNAEETGTKVVFFPERKWFDKDFPGWEDPLTPPWNAEAIEERIRQNSYLVPSLELIFENQKTGRQTVYQSKGLEEYALELAGENEILNFKVPKFNQSISVENENLHVQAVLLFTNAMEFVFRAFTNNIPNPEGGEHVNAFRAGFLRAVSAVAQGKRWAKGEYDSDDLLRGAILVLSLRMSGKPDFSSQTKARLTSRHIRQPVQNAVTSFYSEWLNKTAGQQLARFLVEQAIQAREARLMQQKQRKLAASKSGSGADASFLYLGKTADIRRSGGGMPVVPVEYTSIYIVEGDSAGGGMKTARDSRIHAVLPLRGKIPNPMKTAAASFLSNEEIKTIVSTLGCGIGKDCDPGSLRYGRIVIATDADVDGAHIRSLLLAFFYEYMKPLLEEGRVFFANPPLYRISYKDGRVEQAFSEEEKNEIVKKGGSKIALISRFKGLGEMNPQQLADAILSVAETKRVSGKDVITNVVHKDTQVVIEDARKAAQTVRLWLGSEEEWRKNELSKIEWDEYVQE